MKLLGFAFLYLVSSIVPELNYDVSPCAGMIGTPPNRSPGSEISAEVAVQNVARLAGTRHSRGVAPGGADIRLGEPTSDSLDTQREGTWSRVATCARTHARMSGTVSSHLVSYHHAASCCTHLITACHIMLHHVIPSCMAFNHITCACTSTHVFRAGRQAGKPVCTCNQQLQPAQPSKPYLEHMSSEPTLSVSAGTVLTDNAFLCPTLNPLTIRSAIQE